MCIKVLALSFPYSLLLKKISSFFIKDSFLIEFMQPKKNLGQEEKLRKTEILNPNSNVFPPVWI